MRSEQVSTSCGQRETEKACMSVRVCACERERTRRTQRGREKNCTYILPTKYPKCFHRRSDQIRGYEDTRALELDLDSDSGKGLKTRYG